MTCGQGFGLGLALALDWPLFGLNLALVQPWLGPFAVVWPWFSHGLALDWPVIWFSL